MRACSYLKSENAELTRKLALHEEHICKESVGINQSQETKYRNMMLKYKKREDDYRRQIESLQSRILELQDMLQNNHNYRLKDSSELFNNSYSKNMMTEQPTFIREEVDLSQQVLRNFSAHIKQLESDFNAKVNF